MTKRSELATRLGIVTLFERCTKGDLRIIARHAELTSVAAGTTIVRQGDHGDAFFLLLQGTAIIERDGVAVGELNPGDWFGELALLDPAPRAATVTVASDADLAVLGTRMFKVLVRELPTLATNLLAALARQARQAGASPHEALPEGTPAPR